MNNQNLLEKQSAIKVLNLVPVEFCKYFTHVLLRQADLNLDKIDPQTPNVKAILDHELIFDTLLEYLWPTIESIVGEELLPTYSYSRLYTNGDALEKHVDRPACEVSVTVQLGKSHDYSWQIHMGKNCFELNEGDAVVYSGCSVPHWRNVCNGPQSFYSGNVFLHYVKKNGKFTNEFGDSTIRIPPSFIKNRF